VAAHPTTIAKARRYVDIRITPMLCYLLTLLIMLLSIDSDSVHRSHSKIRVALISEILIANRPNFARMQFAQRINQVLQ